MHNAPCKRCRRLLTRRRQSVYTTLTRQWCNVFIAMRHNELSMLSVATDANQHCLTHALRWNQDTCLSVSNASRQMTGEHVRWVSRWYVAEVELTRGSWWLHCLPLCELVWTGELGPSATLTHTFIHTHTLRQTTFPLAHALSVFLHRKIGTLYNLKFASHTPCPHLKTV